MIGVSQTGSDTLIKMTAPQIADDLADRIRRGEYGPGEQLHYEQLMRLYDVKRDTIKRAMGLLRFAGLVEYHPGRGTYVREDRPS
jgi:DNA-binding GntR family transcriptional regulator